MMESSRRFSLPHANWLAHIILGNEIPDGFPDSDRELALYFLYSELIRIFPRVEYTGNYDELRQRYLNLPYIALIIPYIDSFVVSRQLSSYQIYKQIIRECNPRGLILCIEKVFSINRIENICSITERLLSYAVQFPGIFIWTVDQSEFFRLDREDTTRVCSQVSWIFRKVEESIV